MFSKRLIINLYLKSSRSKYQKKISEAMLTITKAIDTYPDWFVAFSGGKDSTVLLDMVRQIKPDTPAVSSIQQYCFPETTAYLNRVDNLIKVASGSDHNTGWSKNWPNEASIPAGVKWLGDKGNVTKNYGMGEYGVFLGTRVDENRKRKLVYSNSGVLFFNKTNQLWQCSPLALLSAHDIWAYIFSHGLDYNTAYDKMDELGLDLDRQRVGPMAVESVVGLGQLSYIKKGWPQLFNEFMTAYPQARQYV